MKRVFAVVALGFAALTLAAFVVVLGMGRLQEHIAWVLVPACLFLMTGLAVIAVDRLQKKKAEVQKEREAQEE